MSNVVEVIDNSPESNWNPVLDVWPSIPNVDEDQLFDYRNVKEWRFKTGTCPHWYHPRGYHPVPYPKKKPQEWHDTRLSGFSGWAFILFTVLFVFAYLLTQA